MSQHTVKPVNKGHPRERQPMVLIDNRSLFQGYIVLFYQGRVLEVWPLFTEWSLFRGGLEYGFDCIYNIISEQYKIYFTYQIMIKSLIIIILVFIHPHFS